jgi:hypothetical protein
MHLSYPWVQTLESRVGGSSLSSSDAIGLSVAKIMMEGVTGWKLNGQ